MISVFFRPVLAISLCLCLLFPAKAQTLDDNPFLPMGGKLYAAYHDGYRREMDRWINDDSLNRITVNAWIKEAAARVKTREWVLLSGFYRHYCEDAKRWKGNLLTAVDGSTLPLPQTEELMQAFGDATNHSVSAPESVTARVCVFYDVLNRPVIKGRLHSYFSSEDDSCIDSMENMNFQGKVFLFDRGYPSFWLLCICWSKSK
jgi:hypothetical protein